MYYVMSDIHGCYKEFIKMLQLINFSENDTLYILGDVLDRGENPLEILEYIMNHGNIILLMGNHENMMLNYFKTKNIFIKKYYKLNWIFNGGNTTLNELNKLENVNKYYTFISNLPLYKEITINNKTYLLVHAGIKPYKNKSLKEILKKQKRYNFFDIRSRFILNQYNFPFIVIFGHTKVKKIFESYMKIDKNRKYRIKNYKIYKIEKIFQTKKNSFCNKDLKILNLNSKIAIDCGCFGGGKLACLRLNDMKEFYIDSLI